MQMRVIKKKKKLVIWGDAPPCACMDGHGERVQAAMSALTPFPFVKTAAPRHAGGMAGRCTEGVVEVDGAGKNYSFSAF